MRPPGTCVAALAPLPLIQPFGAGAYSRLCAVGQVILFSEGMTHNAYPVLSAAIRRRSIFFCCAPPKLYLPFYPATQRCACCGRRHAVDQLRQPAPAAHVHLPGPRAPEAAGGEGDAHTLRVHLMQRLCASHRCTEALHGTASGSGGVCARGRTSSPLAPPPPPPAPPPAAATAAHSTRALRSHAVCPDSPPARTRRYRRLQCVYEANLAG